MRHEVRLRDIQDWIESNPMREIASSTADDKVLYATFKGGFEVHKGKEVVLRTMQPFDAVEAYNNI